MAELKKVLLMTCFLSLLVLVSVPALLFAEGAREIELGEVFPPACADCHGPDPEYPLLGVREGYNHSGHKNGYENELPNAYYANGVGCQRCHTNEGFIEYVKTGTVDPKTYVSYPSQPGCFTCHDAHTTGDFSLRTTEKVTLINGEVFNGGDGNLCASCHQARSIASDMIKATEAKNIAPYWGAHHGPQADMVKGTNAFEFPGKKYSSSMHVDVIGDTCVQCHMSLPEGRYSMSSEVGGHSFNIGGEVHHAEKLNTAGCIMCHDDIKQVKGKDIFDKKAADDYDNDGTVEPLQAEVEGIMEHFVNGGGTGYLQRTNPPMYKADGSWGFSRSGQWSADEIAALYNYKFVLEDRSHGIHNATYTIQILYDSIEALDRSVDTSSKRPR